MPVVIIVLIRNSFGSFRQMFVKSEKVYQLDKNLMEIMFISGGGMKGFARSMPTAGAVDLVAKKKGKPCFEVQLPFFTC